MTFRKGKGDIVKDVTPETMDGDTPAEKELNAYLTRQFILPTEMPSDECLSEAKEVIRMVRADISAKEVEKAIHDSWEESMTMLNVVLDLFRPADEAHNARVSVLACLVAKKLGGEDDEGSPS